MIREETQIAHQRVNSDLRQTSGSDDSIQLLRELANINTSRARILNAAQNEVMGRVQE